MKLAIPSATEDLNIISGLKFLILVLYSHKRISASEPNASITPPNKNEYPDPGGIAIPFHITANPGMTAKIPETDKNSFFIKDEIDFLTLIFQSR